MMPESARTGAGNHVRQNARDDNDPAQCSRRAANPQWPSAAALFNSSHSPQATITTPQITKSTAHAAMRARSTTIHRAARIRSRP